MYKNHTTNQELPKSGLTILPDGRVQVIFDGIKAEQIIDLPKHVYNLVQELSFSEHEFTPCGRTGLFFVLEVTKELVPAPEHFIESIRKAG
ncbi:MAG: hypothetical protein AAFP77_16300 [Bacteroidota bacterium]